MIDTDPQRCSICISKIKEDEQQKMLDCAHLFHTACIDGWLSIDASCPNCRAVVKVELIPEVKPIIAESEESNPLFLSFLIDFVEAIPEDEPNARLIRARINRLSRGMPAVEEIPTFSFRASIRNSRLGHVARRIRRGISRLFSCRA